MLDWSDESSSDDETSYDEPLAEEYTDDPYQDSEDLIDEDSAQGALDEMQDALERDPGVDLDNVDTSIEQEWSDTYLTDNTAPASGVDRMALQTYRTSLSEHLFDQLEQLDLPSNKLSWALRIIETLNPDGYLTESIQEIAKDSAEGETVSEELLQSVLEEIHKLHPAGVGARDLRECLLIQLHDIQKVDPVQELACQVVQDQGAVLVVDRAAAPAPQVVLGHLLQPAGRDVAAAGHVAQEGHDLRGALRAAEGDNDDGVVDRGCGCRCRHRPTP